jgi:hypothetical protein
MNRLYAPLDPKAGVRSPWQDQEAPDAGHSYDRDEGHPSGLFGFCSRCSLILHAEALSLHLGPCSGTT